MAMVAERDLRKFPAYLVQENLARNLKKFLPKMNREALIITSSFFLAIISAYNIIKHDVALAAGQLKIDPAARQCTKEDIERYKDKSNGWKRVWEFGKFNFVGNGMGRIVMVNDPSVKPGQTGEIVDIDNEIGVLGGYQYTKRGAVTVCTDYSTPFQENSIIKPRKIDAEDKQGRAGTLSTKGFARGTFSGH